MFSLENSNFKRSLIDDEILKYQPQRQIMNILSNFRESILILDNIIFLDWNLQKSETINFFMSLLWESWKYLN